MGPIVRFKIVLDANEAVRELIHKLKHPKVLLTALEEAAKASVVEIHAPKWLDVEMDISAIPNASVATGIPEPVLRASWENYKAQITFHDEYALPDFDDAECADPKDMPYILLESAIGAIGIYTGDKHITELGGTVITAKFVLSTRSYARAASYVFCIRVGGGLVGYATFGLVTWTVKTITTTIARLPPAAQLALLAGAVFVAANPQARARVANALSVVGEALIDVWPMMEKLIELSNQKKIDAAEARSLMDNHLAISRASALGKGD
jgi:hypothetical protein